ncbi:MAG: lipoate--protein ligase family protein [Opitutales bacterium]|jgi:lipoate-protein ligase A
MLILDPETDPAFNLSAEEFLLRNFDEPVVRLWRNVPCVVVGRHQIPRLEVNLAEAGRRGIPVFRRISGGGAVYHDLGNVNFSFIAPLGKGQSIDFDRMLAPVVDALNALGIPALHIGRGDVRLGGAKISGSAAYLWRGRCLHHGTLLFDADLDALEALLDVPAATAAHEHSVRSVRSRVVNIARHSPGRFANTEEFMGALGRELMRQRGSPDQTAREFSADENVRIAEIGNGRYATSDWNLGEHPGLPTGAPA